MYIYIERERYCNRRPGRCRGGRCQEGAATRIEARMLARMHCCLSVGASSACSVRMRGYKTGLSVRCVLCSVLCACVL